MQCMTFLIGTIRCLETAQSSRTHHFELLKNSLSSTTKTAVQLGNPHNLPILTFHLPDMLMGVTCFLEH